jgi:hypothetical protein
MTLAEAARAALSRGCELVPAEGSRVLVRAIAYDADPYELDERQLYAMSAEEFLREWIPERYVPGSGP